MAENSRLAALDGIHNIRDLGGYAREDGSETSWGRMYRGCAQRDLTEQGVAELHALGIRTVIDLRTTAERAAVTPAVSGTPGVEMIPIPLFDGLAPPTEMFAGKREFDLGDRYIAALSECSDNFATVMSAIADAEDGPLLFHCTAGKDRTGLIAAMVLSLATVSDETIAHDYGLTATLGKELVEKLTERIIEYGNRPEAVARFMTSRPESMTRFLAHLNEHHGGAREYLVSTGVDDAALERIASRIAPA